MGIFKILELLVGICPNYPFCNLWKNFLSSFYFPFWTLLKDFLGPVQMDTVVVVLLHIKSTHFSQLGFH